METLEELRKRRERTRAYLHRVLERAGADGENRRPEDVRVLEDIVCLDPGYFAPHFHLACVLEALGQKEQALIEYARAVERDPHLGHDVSMSLVAYEALAEASESKGMTDQALRWLHRFIASFPESPEATLVAERVTAMAQIDPGWLPVFQCACQVEARQGSAQARVHLEQLARLHPGFAPGLLRLGVALREGGQGEDALPLLEEAYRLDACPRALIEMGMVYGSIGNSFAEEASYRRALDLAPLDAGALAHLGTALTVSGEPAEALDFLERALEVDPDGPWSSLAQDRIAAVMRSGFVAVPECLQDPITWKVIGDSQEGMTFNIPSLCIKLPRESDPLGTDRLHYGDRETDPVLDIRLRMLYTSGNVDPDAWIRQAEGRATRIEGHQVYSKERRSLGGLPGHVMEFRQRDSGRVVLSALMFRGDQVFEFRASCPHFICRHLRRIVGDMLSRCQFLAAESVRTVALQQCNEELEKRPDDVALLVRKGDALRALDRTSEAESCYTGVLAIDPQNGAAHAGLGACHWAQGKVKPAIKHLEAAASGRKDAASLSLLGQAWQQRNRAERAIRAFSQAIEIAPFDLPLRHRLAGALELEGNHDEAEQVLLQALDLSPDDIQTRILLGALYRTTKRRDESISCLRRAVEIDCKNAQAHFELGVSYMEAGNYDRAEKALKEAGYLDPTSTAVSALLDELDSGRRGGRW